MSWHCKSTLKSKKQKTDASKRYQFFKLYVGVITLGILLELFLTFAKIGLFTFGGGYAMISLIEHTCVEQKKWISNDDMMNITIITESTPGPIAINCATFVGYKKKGFIGALVARLALRGSSVKSWLCGP